MKRIAHHAIAYLLLSSACGVAFGDESSKQQKNENGSTGLGNSMLVMPVGEVYAVWDSKKYSGIGSLFGAIGGFISGYIDGSTSADAIAANQELLATVVAGENLQPTFGVNLAEKLKACKINATEIPLPHSPEYVAWIQSANPVTPQNLTVGKGSKYFVETGIDYFKVTAGLTSDSLIGYGVAKIFNVETRAFQKKYTENNGFSQSINLNHFTVGNPKATEELQIALKEVVQIVSQNIANGICSDYGNK